MHDHKTMRAVHLPSSHSTPDLTIALAGQPNVGKSTVFNMLTGLDQHVGNWPGKTIEKKVGFYSQNNMTIQLVDLPGTYSLSANSLEERIARDYIITQSPDVVIVITNAASLERNLYLVAELLSIPVPIILGLNMMDIARQHGIHIETHVLEAALGIPVVPLVATKNMGLRQLMLTAIELASKPADFKPSRPEIREDHQLVLFELRLRLADWVPESYSDDWVALKLLEGDDQVTDMIKGLMPPKQWQCVQAILMQHEDAILDVAGGRYDWIRRMIRAALIHPSTGLITITDRIDHIATHPVLGLILLSVVLGLVFWLTFSLAVPLQNWLDSVLVKGVVVFIRDNLQNAPEWLVSLIIDGIIAGAGTVLTFLPVLVLFFFFFGLLEDIGYLSRGAFVMDRFMHPMGLHGKSCLPLFIGFGCNVPAVMAGRVVEAEGGRLLTILLTPLVPCAGRLTVLTFLAPIFFGSKATLISFSLVTINLLVLVATGLFLNRLFFGGERMPFIMELPLYHKPNLQTISLFILHRSKVFLATAGSIILIVSIIVWALARFPGPSIENSVLSTLGRSLAPIAALMGLDWRMMVALLSSFLAKENTIATMGVLFQAGQIGTDLKQAIAGSLTPVAALAFLAVQMLFIPCVATVAVMYRETGSFRWTALSVMLLLVISFTVGIAIYQSVSIFNL